MAITKRNKLLETEKAVLYLVERKLATYNQKQRAIEVKEVKRHVN